jgi:hypothetical protein
MPSPLSPATYHRVEVVPHASADGRYAGARWNTNAVAVADRGLGWSLAAALDRRRKAVQVRVDQAVPPAAVQPEAVPA